MDLVKWDDALSVEIMEIDGQHKKLVKNLNTLYDAMKKGKSKDALGAILNDLVSYTD